nr:hypothetical protein [Rhodococcus sp. (in: high G+C Gram-positive bacteria)]
MLTAPDTRRAAPCHAARRTIPRPFEHDEASSLDANSPGLEPASATSSSDYYRIGIDARRRAHEDLADVPDIADDLENRIEQLLERTPTWST